MKKLLAVLLAALMLVCLLVACSDQGEDDKKGNSGNDDPTVVNLMDMYSVKDPEGLEYDKRVALYMPTLESDESYAVGLRHSFVVLYGKDGKGVFMYDVEIFDSEESATAYKNDAGDGKVDGAAWISESDATFFAAMEAFIPDLQTWIDNMSMSGMIELD